MLSICVNVKNGERYLVRCLSSLAKFVDIILLDNYSTDSTLEIARKFSNVRVYQCEFQGMGKVRNLAASYAKNDWVLFVDCDEVLEPLLVDALLEYQFEREHIYNIYRKNYYDGYLLESSSWGNDWVRRLYNRLDTKFDENQVHENVVNNLPNVKLSLGAIRHFPYENATQLIDKMQFYSGLYAKQHFNNKRPRLWLLPWRAFFMFIKCYLIKGGIKDGYEGLTISMANAIGVWNKYLKLYELYYKKKFAVACKVSAIEQAKQVVSAINQQILLPEIVLLLTDKSSELAKSNPLPAELACVTEFKLLVVDDVDDALNKVLHHELNDLDAIAYCEDISLLQQKKYVHKIRKLLQHDQTSDEIRFFSKLNPK